MKALEDVTIFAKRKRMTQNKSARSLSLKRYRLSFDILLELGAGTYKSVFKKGVSIAPLLLSSSEKTTQSPLKTMRGYAHCLEIFLHH